MFSGKSSEKNKKISGVVRIARYFLSTAPQGAAWCKDRNNNRNNKHRNTVFYNLLQGVQSKKYATIAHYSESVSAFFYVSRINKYLCFSNTKHQYDMNKNSFIISDESVNSYGYIVKTDGIDTTIFERNPVMLYMHERKTVVGRWENIRKEGNKMLADAVFDESTELGRTVKAQVENGFLRSASIGVDIIEDMVINGIKTTTKCSLFEVSIVDIPANQNALKLYRKGSCKRLTLETAQKVEDLRSEIITLLGLADDVSDEDIIAEIQTLLNVPDEASIEVENAVKAGFVESKDKSNFLTMARISPQTFHSFISGKKKKT